MTTMLCLRPATVRSSLHVVASQELIETLLPPRPDLAVGAERPRR